MAFAAVAALAGAAVAAGALLRAAGAWSVPLAVVGWFVAGPVAIGLLAVHAVALTRARAAAVVDVRSGGTVAGYWAVLVVAAAGIALGAWRIADWAGRS